MLRKVRILVDRSSEARLSSNAKCRVSALPAALVLEQAILNEILQAETGVSLLQEFLGFSTLSM